MSNQVPQTIVKLSQQLALIGFQQVDDTANPFDASNVANIIDTVLSLRFIGATNRFKVSQDRTVHPRQGVGDVEPFATVPGNVTTKIEMDRVMLNTEDAMGAFQFMSGNIAFQTRPLIILELTVPALGPGNVPVVNAGVAESRGGAFGRINELAHSLLGNKIEKTVTQNIGRSAGQIMSGIMTTLDLAKTPTYTGCWIVSRSAEYKLDGAQAVVENLTLAVSRISSLAGVVAPSQELSIIQNMPIVTRGVQIARSVGKVVAKL
jgi:hypothetical protein